VKVTLNQNWIPKQNRLEDEVKERETEKARVCSESKRRVTQED
jgi:hypothetical protein